MSFLRKVVKAKSLFSKKRGNNSHTDDYETTMTDIPYKDDVDSHEHPTSINKQSKQNSMRGMLRGLWGGQSSDHSADEDADGTHSVQDEHAQPRDTIDKDSYEQHEDDTSNTSPPANDAHQDSQSSPPHSPPRVATQDDVDRINLMVAKLQYDVQLLREENDILIDQVEGKEKLCEALTKKVKDQSRVKREILEAFKATEDELDRKLAEYQEMEVKNGLQAQELSELKENVSTNAIENGRENELLAVIKNLEKKINILQVSEVQLKDELHHSTANDDDDDSLHNTIAELEKALQDKSDENVELISKILTLQDESSHIQSELQLKTTENSEMMQRMLLNEDSQRVLQVEEKLEAQISFVQTLELNIRGIQAEKSQLESARVQDNEKHEKELQELRLLLQTTEAAKNILEVDNERYQSQLHQLLAQQSDYESKLSETARELDFAKSELDEAQLALRIRLEKQSENELDDVYTNATQWQTQKIKELNELIIENEHNKERLVAEHKRDLEEETFVHFSLRNEINSLRETIAVLSRQQETLEAEKQELLQNAIDRSFAESSTLSAAEIARGNALAREEEIKMLVDVCHELTKELEILRSPLPELRSPSPKKSISLSLSTSPSLKKSDLISRAPPPPPPSTPPQSHQKTLPAGRYSSPITYNGHAKPESGSQDANPKEPDNLTRTLLRGAMMTMLSRSRSELELENELVSQARASRSPQAMQQQQQQQQFQQQQQRHKQRLYEQQLLEDQQLQQLLEEESEFDMQQMQLQQQRRQQQPIPRSASRTRATSNSPSRRVATGSISGSNSVVGSIASSRSSGMTRSRSNTPNNTSKDRKLSANVSKSSEFSNEAFNSAHTNSRLARNAISRLVH